MCKIISQNINTYSVLLMSIKSQLHGVMELLHTFCLTLKASAQGDPPNQVNYIFKYKEININIMPNSKQGHGCRCRCKASEL